MRTCLHTYSHTHAYMSAHIFPRTLVYSHIRNVTCLSTSTCSALLGVHMYDASQPFSRVCVHTYAHKCVRMSPNCMHVPTSWSVLTFKWKRVRNLVYTARFILALNRVSMSARHVCKTVSSVIHWVNGRMIRLAQLAVSHCVVYCWQQP